VASHRHLRTLRQRSRVLLPPRFSSSGMAGKKCRWFEGLEPKAAGTDSASFYNPMAINGLLESKCSWYMTCHDWCWNLRCPIFQSEKSWQTLGSLGNPPEAPAALMIAPPAETNSILRRHDEFPLKQFSWYREECTSSETVQLQGSAEETWHYETRDAWVPISQNSGFQIL